MKLILKVPGTKRLRLKYDNLLSNLAFNINLRRYTGVLEGLDASLARGVPIALILSADRLDFGRAVQVDSIKTHVESAYGVSA
jgi:hypothetical protein